MIKLSPFHSCKLNGALRTLGKHFKRIDELIERYISESVLIWRNLDLLMDNNVITGSSREQDM